MKLSDVVAKILFESGVRVVFGVSGGACLHLIDSINKQSGLNFISTHHEQNAGMAADGVSRTAQALGCAVVTSGPGATNLVTAISGCFFDSIPCLFIAGQVSTNRQKGELGVRQIGFQETPVKDIVKEITKHVLVIDKENYTNLEKLLWDAIRIALSDRPGPVLIEIPDDLQRVEIAFSGKVHKETISISATHKQISDKLLNELTTYLEKAKKPVLILGNGLNVSNTRQIFRKFTEETNWPILTTWAVKDLLPWNLQNNLGTFGTHGIRSSNLIVQNSDLVISIGSRLDTKSTGSPISTFAPKAKKVIVDIDSNELSKFRNWGLEFDLEIQLDLRDDALLDLLKLISSKPASSAWLDSIKSVQSLLIEDPQKLPPNSVDPYLFMKNLSSACPEETTIFLDTGCAVAWAMQAWQNKSGHRLYHDFNNTAMGWSIPASFGYSCSGANENIIAICGDGSFMMALQEIPNFVNLENPIKIFLLNNSGYSMIKQTQDQWFKSDYFASDANRNLRFPNFELLSRSFGIDYCLIEDWGDLDGKVSSVLNSKLTVLCEVKIDPIARVIPQTKFGNTLEYMDPSIDNSILMKAISLLQSS